MNLSDNLNPFDIKNLPPAPIQQIQYGKPPKWFLDCCKRFYCGRKSRRNSGWTGSWPQNVRLTCDKAGVSNYYVFDHCGQFRDECGRLFCTAEPYHKSDTPVEAQRFASMIGCSVEFRRAQYKFVSLMIVYFQTTADPDNQPSPAGYPMADAPQ